MDLLLTHGYFLHEDLKELQILKPYPPLGLLSLSGFLKSKGYGVEIYDSTFQTRPHLERLLCTEPPGLLGIYANLMTRPNVIRIIQSAKHSGWDVIVGGPEPMNYVEEYLSAGADAIVVGEGELTLEEILDRRRKGKCESFRSVSGIVVKGDDGRAHNTGPRNLIPELDSLPWPDRSGIDIDPYLTTWKSAHGKSSVSLITSRGCPYHCRWCSHAVYGKTHRRRSPQSVADEIEWIRDRYHPDMLWFADDVFTIHHRWLFEFAEVMKRRHLNIPFECITRADRVNESVADVLAGLECFRVWIGSESGSQRILDHMERNVTVEQVRKCVSLCKDRGIQTGMFLMWGYHGEELSDIEATIHHVKQTDPDIFFTTVAYPIKGTEYYKDISSELIASLDWQKSSDRDYKIRGRHSKSYYHYADQLLKNEVALHRAQVHGGKLQIAQIPELKRAIVEARNGLVQTQQEVEA